MTITYMVKPTLKITITHSGIDYTFDSTNFSSIDIKRIENGFDSGTFVMTDPDFGHRKNISAGDLIKAEVKDASENTFTTLFYGKITSVDSTTSLPDGRGSIIKADGSGYGFAATLCGQEYGAGSKNSTLTLIHTIIRNATAGIIPKWVNKILGSAVNSGYTYTTNVETIITSAIDYILFPYKPCNKCIDDLCDLITAKKAGNAGPHWMVDPNNVFFLKSIDATKGTWYKYYSNSQTTLSEGKDFKEINSQELDVLANYILYFGRWIRPTNDGWTEDAAANWDDDGADFELFDNADCKIGNNCVRGVPTKAVAMGVNMWYPQTGELNLKFGTISTKVNLASINFWIKKKGITAMEFRCWTGNVANNDYYKIDIISKVSNDDKWYALSLTAGEYAKEDEDAWVPVGAPDWNNIDHVGLRVSVTAPVGAYVHIDDLNIQGVICRGAKNSTNITANKLKTHIVVDEVAKDDSASATDDSGTIAQLAYAELLRCQTTPTVATIVTSMIKDLLPGQWLHIHGLKYSDGIFKINTDMRVPELHQIISSNGFLTKINLTDDLTNSHARTRYDDLNTVLASMRPEFQDRQASNIKAAEIDIEATILEKDYP